MIEQALPRGLLAELRVVQCDRDHEGRYVRWAGLACAHDALVAEYYRTGKHPALLIVGLFPPAFGNAGLTPRIRAMLDWPGVAYLAYGFTRDQLIAAARRAIEGAKTPLPPGLLPTAGDVLRLTSEIRHWLENRLRNTEGALNDFQRARLGEIQLHRTYLDPVAPVTEEHRAMLDRLWALEAPAERFAPRTGGLGPLKGALAEFENSWQALEAARSALRASGIKGEEQGLTETVAEFARVYDALQSAIKATRELDNEMTERKGN